MQDGFVFDGGEKNKERKEHKTVPTDTHKRSGGKCGKNGQRHKYRIHPRETVVDQHDRGDNEDGKHDIDTHIDD